MHGIDAARLQFLRAATAAIHADDCDIKAVGCVEPSGLRHPEGQHRIHGLGDADLEMRHFRGGHGVHPSGEQERQSSKPPAQFASMSIAMFPLHVGFLLIDGPYYPTKAAMRRRLTPLS